MKKKWLYSSVMTAFIMLSGCDPHNQSSTTSALVLEGRTMGTFWRISLAGVVAERKENLQNLVQRQLDGDDQTLSTWKKDSAISRFNQYRGSDPQPVSDDMADIILLSLRIGQKTAGKMDITVGPLVNLWGFGPTKQPAATPTQTQIDATRALTGLEHLRLIQRSEGAYLQKDLPDLYLDLSTVGEGFATDHLARLLEKEGINNYLVSVGGAVLTRGKNAQGEPWKVAIQKPDDKENAVQAVVDLQGHGISTSGSYRNYYELNGKRISHIIDPISGRPIQHKLVSATVIATTALEADGWDTGLMVLGEKAAQALALREKLAVYLIVKKGDGFTTWMSPQFKAFILQQ